MCERAGRENQRVEEWEWGLKASFSPCGSQRKRKMRRGGKRLGNNRDRREGSVIRMRLRYSHRMFSIGLCSLAGHMSAGDDSHLSFLRLVCRWHSVCYQQHSLIPIMVCTHCLLPWHQSRPCWASADDQTSRNDWKSHRGKESLFMEMGPCAASIRGTVSSFRGGTLSDSTNAVSQWQCFRVPLFWRWNAGGKHLGHIHQCAKE